MAPIKRSNDSVFWFMNDLTSRIVAESGIPSDRHHLGKMILQGLKDFPDMVMQIDGATGETETNRSALERSVRCAESLRRHGLQAGDVIVLMAPNHLDIAIPFYAALYLGVMIAAVDRNLSIGELEGTLGVCTPKLIFCQSEKAPDIQLALNNIELNSQIITFDKGDYLLSFNEFLAICEETISIENFRATEFNPETTSALLIATSGTTGLPKAAETTHKNFAITLPYIWASYMNFPNPTRMAFICSPLQWLTALIHCIASPILSYTRLQTSLPLTAEHACNLIDTYKPTYTVLSPTFLTALLGHKDLCDFASFELIMLGGSAVPVELITKLKSVSPNTDVYNVFGMSELTGICFTPDFSPPGSCGRPMGCLQYKLLDIETQDEIEEPNVRGELCLKGPGIFKGYYKNITATAEAFTEDGWFKTGDMFYRDENWNFFFCERLKLLLKYKSYQISPVELENVIRKHPAVLDVAVTGLPDPECGELPVACVVRRPGYDVNDNEIINLVQENLSESKQLRGGVLFMNEIPMTASTKVHRRKLKEIVLKSCGSQGC
ncbi:luciferin 4-monooxygenase-like [Leptidea sinapis]|nr:luciferin 4-monooxygenase-like [Leptidea sinapis]XP_050666966.1 luciferin 4-monooxygenase-like [Leptidea sinapis]